MKDIEKGGTQDYIFENQSLIRKQKLKVKVI